MTLAIATPDRIPRMSRFDNARFAVGYTFPNWLQGLFTRRRFWVGVIARLHPDPLGLRLIGRLRRKYRSDLLWARVGRAPTILVLGADAVRRVLDQSPAVYADPPPKREGMSRFQPEAVTISRGEAWLQRRRYNEAVLGFGNSVHPLAQNFLAIVREECRELTRPRTHVISWPQIERLFERIMLGVIFGGAARDDRYLWATLRKLMRSGNAARLPAACGLRDEFESVIQSYLTWPRPGSLAGLVAATPTSGLASAARQIPHWMFAMNETLAANTARAMALIAAFPEIQESVQQELSQARCDRPVEIDALPLLGGCLQEAMRLWPTTPMLMRELIDADSLGAATIARGTRVLIPTTFLNRDLQSCVSAQEFQPRRWIENPADDRFHHLSNGTQACAGKPLALFLGKSVLATILQGGKFRLRKPRIPAGRPIPEAFNYFRLRLSVVRRSA